MYPYHNRIKQRIRAGELINYRFEKNYPRIGECMVLEFCTWPQRRTVRIERLVEYVRVMDEWHKRVKGLKEPVGA